jgi:hypothetical protein
VKRKKVGVGKERDLCMNSTEGEGTAGMGG